MINQIRITDFNATELDIYARTKEVVLLNRAKPEDGIFIAESPKVIERALDSGCEPISILMEERHIEGEGKSVLERCGDIPVYTGSRDVLSKLTGYTLTRGVLCAMRRKALPTVDAVLANARRVVVIDGVVDSTNVGAIFRSAAALGIDSVLITPDSCDPLNRRAVRVSMGSVFLVPWTWLHSPISSLHEKGFATAAMALTNDSIGLNDPRLKQEPRLAIVMGTEGDGLRANVIAHATYVVRIPMSHHVDSLNVAAASAVAFWELSAKHL